MLDNMLLLCEYVAIAIAIAMYSLKIAWNLYLPYGMIKLKPGHKVSLFPLIEIVPMVFSAGISYLADIEGVLYYKNILCYGIAIAIFSYVHLIVAGLAIGVTMKVRGKEKEKRPG